MDIDDKIRAMVKEGAGRTKLMRAFPNVSEWQIRKIIQEVRGGPTNTPTNEKIRVVHDGDTVELDSGRGTQIKSLDDLLAVSPIDLSVWEVEKCKVNKWDVGTTHPETGEIVVQDLWQVTATFKKNRNAELQKFKEDLLEDLRNAAPEYPDVSQYLVEPEDPHMLEVCMFDLHLGKLALPDSTGGTYNIEEAKGLFFWALDDLLHKASNYGIDRIVFPITEILHVDSDANTTTRGTPQDMDQSWYVALRTAREVTVQAIERLMQIAPVDVVIIPGNHARRTEIALGEILDAQFSKTDAVTVHGGPKPRKYIRYGVNLLGYAHGDGEKMDMLPLIMATECPRDWAESEFREFHIGHWHKKKERKFTPVDEFNGVRVRVLPSLSGADAWHTQAGYVGSRRSAEAYLWNKSSGYAGHLSANVISKVA